MTYTGRIQNGVIVLNDEGITLPEGGEVRVEIVVANKGVDSTDSEEPRRTLAERLHNSIGKTEGLPPDAASRIDEHLYGDNAE